MEPADVVVETGKDGKIARLNYLDPKINTPKRVEFSDGEILFELPEYGDPCGVEQTTGTMSLKALCREVACLDSISIDGKPATHEQLNKMLNNSSKEYGNCKDTIHSPESSPNNLWDKIMHIFSQFDEQMINNVDNQVAANISKISKSRSLS